MTVLSGGQAALASAAAFVEVVIERGSGQSMRREVVLSSEALRVQPGGDEEVGIESLRFGRAFARSRQ